MDDERLLEIIDRIERDFIREAELAYTKLPRQDARTVYISTPCGKNPFFEAFAAAPRRPYR